MRTPLSLCFVFTRGAGWYEASEQQKRSVCCGCGFRDMAAAKGYTWDGGNWRVRRGSLGAGGVSYFQVEQLGKVIDRGWTAGQFVIETPGGKPGFQSQEALLTRWLLGLRDPRLRVSHRFCGTEVQGFELCALDDAERLSNMVACRSTGSPVHHLCSKGSTVSVQLEYL